VVPNGELGEQEKGELNPGKLTLMTKEHADGTYSELVSGQPFQEIALSLCLHYLVNPDTLPSAALNHPRILVQTGLCCFPGPAKV
jgi:hypothetical protein